MESKQDTGHKIPDEQLVYRHSTVVHEFCLGLALACCGSCCARQLRNTLQCAVVTLDRKAAQTLGCWFGKRFLVQPTAKSCAHSPQNCLSQTLANAELLSASVAQFHKVTTHSRMPNRRAFCVCNRGQRCATFRTRRCHFARWMGQLGGLPLMARASNSHLCSRASKSLRGVVRPRTPLEAS